MQWPAGQRMVGRLGAEGLIGGTGGSGGLAALFLPPVPCVWVRWHGMALKEEQGLMGESPRCRAGRASLTPLASCGNVAVSLLLS